MNKTLLKAIVFVFSTFVFLQCTKETASEPEPIVITEPVSTDPNIGCTDAAATNFKSTATEDDCSCKYDYESKVSGTIPQDFTKKSYSKSILVLGVVGVRWPKKPLKS